MDFCGKMTDQVIMLFHVKRESTRTDTCLNEWVSSVLCDPLLGTQSAIGTKSAVHRQVA